jgi:hypothetical protein
MEAYGSVMVYLRLFLTSVLHGGMWSFSQPVALVLVKESLVLIKYEAGCPHRRSGLFGEWKNILALPRRDRRFLCCPVLNLVMYGLKIK